MEGDKVAKGGTNFLRVTIDDLRFEIQKQLLSVKRLFDTGRGKWFSEEMYIVQFDKEITERAKQMMDQEYIRKEEAEVLVKEEWIKTLSNLLCNELQNGYEGSEIEAIFKRNDDGKLRKMYQTLAGLRNLSSLGSNISSRQFENDIASVRNNAAKFDKEWYKDGSLLRINADITRSLERVKIFHSACMDSKQVRNFNWKWKLEPNRRDLMHAVEEQFSVRRMLENEESELVRLLKSGNDKEIGCLYQTCISVYRVQFEYILDHLLRFELKEQSAHIEAFVRNNSGKWFDGKFFNELFEQLSKACGLISLRCASAGWVYRNEKLRSFCGQTAGYPIMVDMQSKPEKVLFSLSLFDREEASRISELCTEKFYMPHLCELILAFMIQIDVENHVGAFLESRGKPGPQGPQNNQILEIPALGIATTRDELKRFFRQLSTMFSQYLAKAVEYWGDDEEKQIPFKKTFRYAITNISSSQYEEPPVLLLAAFYTDLIITTAEDHDTLQDLLEPMKHIVNWKTITVRFSLISRQNQMRRLLKCGFIAKSNRIKREHMLLRQLEDYFGNDYGMIQRTGFAMIQRMRTFLADFERAKLVPYTCPLRPCSEDEKMSQPIGTATIIRPTPVRDYVQRISVLNSDRWNIGEGDKFILLNPLVEVIHQYKDHLICCNSNEAEGRKTVAYAHTLRTATLETWLFSKDRKATVEIVGCALQASVIHLFNSHDSITFAQLFNAFEVMETMQGRTYVSLNKRLISAIVQSLLSSACPLLKKEPESEKINGSDVLCINGGFIAPTGNVQLPDFFKFVSIEEEEFDDEENYMLDKVMRARQLVTLTVMKVMEKKRKLYLNDLIGEVVSYGKPVPSDVEDEFVLGRVGLLAERQYLVLDGHIDRNPVVTYPE